MDTFIFSFRLSFQVALTATLCSTFLGVFIAYLLALKTFRFKEFLDTIITLPIILPPTITGFYLILIFGRNGIIGGPLFQLTGFTIMFTWEAAVLASFVVSVPLMIKTVRATIESIDHDMIRASHNLGYGEWQTFWNVILPLSKKGILAAIILSFARAMGEFGATLMLAGNIPGKTNTIPLTIYSLANNGEWQKAHIIVIIYTLLAVSFLSLSKKLAGAKTWF